MLNVKYHTHLNQFFINRNQTPSDSDSASAAIAIEMLI